MISYVYYDALQRQTANAAICFLTPFNPEFNNEFITHYIVLLPFPKKYGLFLIDRPYISEQPFNRRCRIYSGFHFLSAH